MSISKMQVRPLKQEQLEKLRRLTFHILTLQYHFNEKEEPEYIKVYVNDLLIAVAEGEGLRKSEKAISLAPLDIKPKVLMDLKKLDMVYSDEVSFATYYPENDHKH